MNLSVVLNVDTINGRLSLIAAGTRDDSDGVRGSQTAVLVVPPDADEYVEVPVYSRSAGFGRVRKEGSRGKYELSCRTRPDPTPGLGS